MYFSPVKQQVTWLTLPTYLPSTTSRTTKGDYNLCHYIIDDRDTTN